MYLDQIIRIFSLLNKQFKIKIIIVILLMLLMSALELIGIGVLAGFIYFLVDIDQFIIKLPEIEIKDYFLSLQYNSKIKLLIFLIVIVFILKNALIFFCNIYFYNFNRQLNLNVVNRVLQKYLKSDYPFFLKNKISTIINNTRDETSRFCGIIMSYLNIFKELVLIIVIIAGLININWKITFSIFLLIFIISTILIYFLKITLIKLGKRRTSYSSKIYKNLYEIFIGIKFIKIKSLEIFFLKKITNKFSSLIDVMFRQSILVLIPRLLLEVMGVMGLCTVIYIFLLLNYSFNEVLPIITFLALVVIRLVPSMASLNTNFNNISANNISFELVSNLIEENKNEIYPIEKNQKVLNEDVEDIHSIELKNVSYKYDNQGTNCLNNINLKIYKNDILGIVGSSGSGKTTLVNIILCLLKPTNGKFFVNDQENKDLKNYRISYVPQDVSILDEGLYSNIAFGSNSKDYDKEKIDNLISLTQLDKQNLDEDTNLGELGLNISGGQKQRIGFARALYDNYDFIALDEPTSELDYEIQKKMMRYIEDSSKSKITILVAHRLETLQICNKIVILKDGTIEDFGSKKEIINKNIYLKKYLDNE